MRARLLVCLNEITLTYTPIITTLISPIKHNKIRINNTLISITTRKRGENCESGRGEKGKEKRERRRSEV